MNSRKFFTYLIVVILLVAIFVLANAFYIVDETQQVVITQFGKPIGDPIKKAGLHIKLPFIQNVNFFEKRILAWDGNPAEILAQDKKFILVDTYARWRIAEPLTFYTSVVNENGAQSQLDNVIEAATRDFVTSHVLIEVVRSSNREMSYGEYDIEFSIDSGIDSISVGRANLAREILNAAKKEVKQVGIDLIDFRIKRINYVDEVRQKVFDRMISERKRIAEKYRSEGMGKKAEIEGQMEKELQRITSEAYRTAQEIKGKADAKAIKIYANAYEKDADFYSFTKSLESYKTTLDEKSWLILSTDSDYLKYLKDINAK